MIDLPPEVLEIIFLEFCPPKTIFPLQGDEPRLLVTQICSKWRAVALALPSLWANIQISLDYFSPLDSIRAWISRSAQSPFSLWFRKPTGHGRSLTAILDLVLPIIQRCTFLDLYIHKPALMRLLALPLGSFRALQEISIKPIFVQSTPIPLPFTTFQQCPQLRKVTFLFVTNILNLADFNLPWHQLTHLEVSSCPFREYECLNVLRQCTALEECRIATLPAPSCDLHKIKALSRCPIVLPSLHTFCLFLSNRANSVHFIHALRLPRLHSLQPALPAPHSPLLPTFQTLLSETIRHLDFSRCTPTDLPGVLALVPNLETLKFRDNNLEVLQALGCGAAPRLVALGLDGVVDSCDLFDMLEARVAAARSDSSIAVLNDVSAVQLNAEGMDTDRLEALRAAGVRVVF